MNTNGLQNQHQQTQERWLPSLLVQAFHRWVARQPWKALVLWLGLLVWGAAAQAAPSLELQKALQPANPTAFKSGETFTYALTWKCAGSISPQDDCSGMKIVDELPSYINFQSAAPVAPVTSISAVTNSNGKSEVTIQFAPTVAAGATGTVQFNVSYVGGRTPDNTVSDNTATISVTNPGVLPVVSNVVTTTAIANDPPKITKSLRQGSADGLMVYDIQYCAKSTNMSTGTGYMDLKEVTLTDVLPTGLTYVSASPTPSAAPAVGTNGAVTWVFPGVTTGSTYGNWCQGLTLLARNNLTVSSVVTNSVNLQAKQINDNPVNLNGQSTVTLQAPTNLPDTVSKNCSTPVYVGGSYNCTLGFNNNNTQVYDTVVFEDHFPPSMDVQGLAPHAGDLVWGPGGWFVQINGSSTWVDLSAYPRPINKSTLVANNVMLATDYITALRVVIANVPTNTRIGQEIITFSYKVINPDRNGVTHPLPYSDTNTAQFTKSYNGIDNTQFASATYQVNAPVEAIAPLVSKRNDTNSDVPPGGTVRWAISLGTWTGSAATVGNPVNLINPTYVDLLPAGMA